MEINKDHITESDKKIVRTKTKKKQIILGHTASSLKDFFTKIETRYNSKYNQLPAFVIGLDGEIHQLYDPHYYSHFMNDEAVDKFSIPVVLENVGWVMQDARDSKWYDWKGHEYSGGTVVQSEWRNKRFWAAYTNDQFESLVWLINKLCTDHKIPKVFVGDNITFHKPKTFKGVINRSNYNKHDYDLSPAMDFDKLNERITGLNKK